MAVPRCLIPWSVIDPSNGVATHRRNFLVRPKAPDAYQDGAKSEQSNVPVTSSLCYTHRICILWESSDASSTRRLSESHET
jgi:hypothetical protein